MDATSARRSCTRVCGGLHSSIQPPLSATFSLATRFAVAVGRRCVNLGFSAYDSLVAEATFDTLGTGTHTHTHCQGAPVVGFSSTTRPKQFSLHTNDELFFASPKAVYLKSSEDLKDFF
mmetsp:Transcript_37067/g.57454  ORF Transcript_37067/g.57454 Transcript_37067/m.57454 type:complete len:119 (+) Transcript_37067:41-397(+)